MATSVLVIEKSADGQVLYTDIPDDTLFSGATYPIDLNNDGIVDYYLGQCDDLLGYFQGGLIANGSAGNAIAGIPTLVNSTYGTYNDYMKLPFKLNYFLDSIGPDNTWVKPDKFVLNWCNNVNPYYHAWFNELMSSSQFGFWNLSAADGYVGLRINIDTLQYYGWARLSVDPAANWMVIKDFAIDTIAGTSILAGQCMCPATGIPDAKENTISIFPNPASAVITLSGMKDGNRNSFISIFNLEGKKLWDKEILESSTQIDVSFLPAGIYFLELKSGEDILVKKFEVER